MGLGRFFLIGSMAAVLAACNGADVGASPTTVATPTAITSSPTVTASSTATPSPPSTTPGTSVAVVPAAARVQTLDGAQAFVRAYFDIVNSSFQGKAGPELGNLSDGNCGSCTNLQSNAEKLRSSGLRVATPPYMVDLFTELPESATPLRIFSAVLIHAKSDVVRQDGTLVRIDPEERNLIEVAVSWRVDGWVVQDLALAKMVAP